jgi:hypothetical protein
MTVETEDGEGNVVQTLKRVLEFECFNGEEVELEGQLSSSLVGSLISCTSFTQLINTEIDRYVAYNSTVYTLDVYASLGFADSSDPQILQTFYNQFVNNANQFVGSRKRSFFEREIEPPLRARRSGGGSASIGNEYKQLLDDGVAAGLAALFFPAAGVGVTYGTLANLFGSAVSDYSGASAAGVSGLLAANQGFQACNGILQGGWGINGLAGCLYDVIDVVGSIVSKENTLETQTQNLETQIAAEEQQVLALQGDVLAVEQLANALQQSVDNLAKTQAESVYAQQEANANIAITAQGVSDAASTQNINNNNILQLLQQTNTNVNQLGINLENQLAQESAVTNAEIQLETRVVYVELYQQILGVKSTFQGIADNLALRLDSASAQEAAIINSILNSVNTNQAAMAKAASLLADIQVATRDLIADRDGLGAVPLLFWNLEYPLFTLNKQLPFVQDWGHYPTNMTDFTDIGVRSQSQDSIQIQNTVTGDWQSCTYPFTSNTWETMMLEALETSAVVTWNVPPTLTRFSAKFGDSVILEVQVGGTWEYITALQSICATACTSCPAGSLPVCTTPTASNAAVFQLQSYAQYQEAHTTVTNAYNPKNITGSSCSFARINSTVALQQCILTVAAPYTAIAANLTLIGSGCSLINITANNTVSTNSLPANCTIGSASYNSSIFYTTTTNVVTPIYSTPSNVLSGNQFYLDMNFVGLGVYRLQPNFVTNTTSNALCLQPVSDINPTYVYTVVNANLTQQALQTYITNTTQINLLTEGGGALYYSGGCLVSNPASQAASPFLLIPDFSVAGVNDTGIPVARRSAPQRRSTPTPTTCDWTSSFALVTDPTTTNEANIAACTAQPGCILARFQRPNTVTLFGGTQATTSIPSGVTATLGLGSYYGTVALSGSYYTVYLNSMVLGILGGTSGSNEATLGVQLSTGMSLQLIVTDPTTGIQGTTFFTTMLQQPFTSILLGYGIFADISASGTGSDTTWIVEFVVDFEPNYPSFEFTDVCVSNYQSDGNTLSSNQCSFLSTSLATLSIPEIGSTTYYYLYLTGTNPVVSATTTAPAAKVYYAGPTSGFAPYNVVPTQLTAGPTSTFSSWANVFNSFTVTTPLEICFATCATVGNDRATCLNVENDRCVWAYSASSGTNTCMLRLEAAQPFNITYVSPGSFGYFLPSYGTYSCSGTYSYNYTLCNNGAPQTVYLLTASSGTCGSQSFTIGPYLLVNNAVCSPSWTFISNSVNLGTYYSANYYYNYPTYSGPSSSLPTLNSCQVSDIASYLGTVWSNSTYFANAPAQYLCLQTKSLSIVGGQYSTTQYSSLASASNATGLWLSMPFVGTPINCVWDLVANTCENYDSVYSNENTQVEIKCEDRLLSQNNVGACVTPPPSGIVYNSNDYRPLCAYVLPSNTSVGSCVTFNFATTPPLAGSVTNPTPYYFPANVSGVATTILSTCLTPGTQCYFENTNTVAYTNSWYQGSPATALAFPCSYYSNDQLGCPLKSYINGTAQCGYNNGVCSPICSILSGNGTACAANLPYNTCYYVKSTQTCNATTSNYIASPTCDNYNCFSAQYICYQFTNNEPGCVANPQCTWLNDVNNATNSYCEMQNLVVDPECTVNGIVESYCNVTMGFGLSAITTATLGACTITDPSLTGSAYVTACVQLTYLGNNCVYTQIGNENFCAAPGDGTVAGYISSNQALMSVTQITYAQYEQALYNPNQTYTMTYSELVNTVLRPQYVTTLATIRNLVTTIPDDVSVFYACANSSYTAVWRYCCLTSEMSGGQCGPTSYVNPLAPVTLFQNVYQELCEQEATALGGHYTTGVHTVTLPIVYIMNSLQGLPTPLDSMNCPTFPNDTTVILNTTTISPYTLSVMVQALQENIKQGSVGCTVNFDSGLDDTLMITNLGALGWYTGSQFWTATIYDGTSFNLTQYYNVQSNLVGQPTSFTDANFTVDFFTDIYQLYGSDIYTFVSMHQVETGTDPRLWFSRLPTGVQVVDHYIPSQVGVYATKNKRAILVGVSSKTAPVYKVLGINPVCEGSITYTLPDGSVQSQPFTTCVVSDPNTALLPQITSVFVHINDRESGIVCSPRYSPGVPCSGQDWYTAISSGPGVQTVNYTDYITVCPESTLNLLDFVNSVCAYSTPLNPINPEYQWCGVTYDTDLYNSSSIATALNLPYLQLNGTVNSQNVTLYQNWNSTITSVGPAVVLAFTQAVQQAWTGPTLQCPDPVDNYILPSASVYGYNGTLLYSQDLMAAAWAVYYPIYVSSFNNTASAMSAVISEVLEPLVSSGTNPYCGNCGQGYLTQCIPPIRSTVKVATLAANYGLCPATRAYTIVNQTNYQWPFVANPGTQTMTVTIEIDQPISAFLGVFSSQCPTSGTGTASPFSCSSNSGVNVCLVALNNPLTTANIAVVVSSNVTSENLACNQPQTLNVPPLGSASTQFIMCEDTTAILTVIQQSTGQLCFSSGPIITTTSIEQQFTNQSTTISQIAITTDNLVSDYLNVAAALTALQNNQAATTANFTVQQNQFYSNVNNNLTVAQQQINALGAGLQPLVDQFQLIQTNFSLIEQYIQFLFFNQSQGLDIQIQEGGVLGNISANIKGITIALANASAETTAQLQNLQKVYDDQTVKLEELTRTFNNLTIEFNNTASYIPGFVYQSDQAQSQLTTYLIVIITLLAVLYGVGIAFFIYVLVKRQKARRARKQNNTPSAYEREAAAAKAAHGHSESSGLPTSTVGAAKTVFKLLAGKK